MTLGGGSAMERSDRKFHDAGEQSYTQERNWTRRAVILRAVSLEMGGLNAA